MSDRYFKILQRNSKSGNYIPSGRQLPRTPPLAGVAKRLDFTDDSEEPQQNVADTTRDEGDPNRSLVVSCLGRNAEMLPRTVDPHSMVKGMKGYQLTAADLEFLKKMKEEQLIKKLQGELEEVQSLLKLETMALELACASKKKAEAELHKFPSCEEVTEWAKVVLKMTSPLTELTNMDARSLLSMVTMKGIQDTMAKKRVELNRIKKMVKNKRKKEAEVRGQLEKQIASEQLKIQRLMRELSDLKVELVQLQRATAEKQMKPVKAARRKKDQTEQQDLNSPESAQPVRSRRKPAKTAQTTVSQQKNQSKEKAGEAEAATHGRKKAALSAHDAGEKTQNEGPRRSKRIANKK